ncbi:unnamed protein product [Pocillopora meandrina]|uniref:Uncharacterized protein n=1 Tax=Pocillopora meandrina TaxID=46732 RepID=A0AAU9XAT5_9CNID|nr:unnamed protein product [Pocillopora meandrina]
MGCYQVRSFPVYCYSWSPRLPSFRDQLSYLLWYGQLLRQQPEIQHTVSCVPGRWSKVQYQEISNHGAHDMTSFEYKGHTYLAVANHYNQKYNINSISYKRM